MLRTWSTVIDCPRTGRVSTCESFTMQVTLKCFRSILHQVYFDVRRQNGWSCELAEVCIAGECPSVWVKVGSEISCKRFLTHLGGWERKQRYQFETGEYFSKHWTEADGLFCGAVPCQTLCAKYSALTRLWGKWSPGLGAMFYSAVWHFSLYWVRSFTAPLACIMEVQTLARKCFSSEGFVAPCQVLWSLAKGEQQRGAHLMCKAFYFH